ncbi:uncharacterized protein [Epargyreus clarus]|uniref:uncharacterized protein n=1 Tax=Epargyreus clarus TaxID=520877 RepID=UPI003C2F0E09
MTPHLCSDSGGVLFRLSGLFMFMGGSGPLLIRPDVKRNCNLIGTVQALSTLGLTLSENKFFTLYAEGKAMGVLITDVAILAASVILEAVGVFGMVGNLKQNLKILHVYSWLLVFLMVLQGIVVTYTSVHKNSMMCEVSEWLTRDFFCNATGAALEQQQKLWDDLQSNFLCCGVDGPRDYFIVRRPISQSCYPAAQNNLHGICAEKLFLKGCKGSIVTVLDHHEDRLVAMVNLNLIFEAFCLPFSFYMVKYGPILLETDVDLSTVIGHTGTATPGGGTMKSRSVRCMKFFLTLFNIICILFGLILMAICVINMRDRKARPEQSALSRGVLSFLLTLGLGLVVTAVLGSVGALREHVKILYVHACFFVFLVSVEVVVAVGGAVLSAWVGGSSELRVQFYKNSTIEEEGAHHTVLWDTLQSENQCCGVDGPQDYAILNRDVPASCCARAHPLREGGARRQLHATCLTERAYYVRGCEEVLRQKKAFKGNIFITIGVIFTLLEVVCIILALWMARTVRAERRKLQENLQAHFES